MNIGYDAKRIVLNATGLGNYGRTLVNDMTTVIPSDTRLFLYAPSYGREELRRQVSPHENVVFKYPDCKFFKSLWRTHGIVSSLKRDNILLYHGLSGELPTGISKAGIKSIVTIHDLIFLRHPEYYNPIDVKLYKWKFHKTCAEANKIIAISECTKRDIIHFGGVDESKIEVIYQSCDTRFRHVVSREAKQQVKEKYRLPDRFVLSVGTIEPRKNALLIVKSLLSESLDKDIHVVLVGRKTKYAQTIAHFASHNGLGERVHFLSGVPTEDLFAIYQQATCFAYPSRYEGFGIPVIEAVQSGLPVVAATGSCLEEAGGPHNLYVSPDNPREMSKAISFFMNNDDERLRRIELSKKYVERFEGSNVARQVWQLYCNLLNTDVER